MTKEEIFEKLRETMKISAQADVDWDTVTPESTIESLGFDSLSILDLIYDVQQGFNIEFEAQDLFDVRTVEELATFLQDKGA